MPKHRTSHTSAYAVAETNAVETQTPNSANEFAAREKHLRTNRFAWAQDRIQKAYEEFGLTDDFLWGALYWYLIFLAAWRLPDFHTIPSRVLVAEETLLDKLPADQQDRVGKFHLQLAADPAPERRLINKWQDIGIPIYRWLNRAFAREWANHRAGEIKNGITHVDVMDAESEISFTDRPRPLHEDDDHKAERERQERALVWNKDLEAKVRADEINLHPGWKMGTPLWKALRSIRGVSEYHAIICDTIAELGRMDYSKITRKLSDAGINVSHDKVRRDMKKIESELKIILDSQENKLAKHNPRINHLPRRPKIEIPEDEQRLRDEHGKRDEKWVTWEEQKAAGERHDRSDSSVIQMPADEYDRLIANSRLIFAGKRMDGQ